MSEDDRISLQKISQFRDVRIDPDFKPLLFGVMNDVQLAGSGAHIIDPIVSRV